MRWDTGTPNYSTDPEGWILANYGPEYLNPDGSRISGPSKTVTNDQGITFTSGRATPETHPWLYPENGVGTTNKDYSKPIYPDEGRPGFVTPTPLSPEEAQAKRDEQNFFRNGGQGLDPRLMAGMIMSGDRNTASNQYGTYSMDRGVSPDNPWGKNSSFSGSGVNYTRDHWGNRDPLSGNLFGQKSMEGLAASNTMLGNGQRARDFYGKYGINPLPNSIGSPNHGSAAQTPTQSGGMGGTGGQSNTPEGPNSGRSWSNTVFGNSDNNRPTPGSSNPALETPAMVALKRALMGQWGG